MGNTSESRAAARTGWRDESRFRAIFEHCGDVILIIDPERDRIVEANPRACLNLGYSREQLLGLSVSALYPDQQGEWQRLVDTAMGEGHAWSAGLTCRSCSGSALAAETSASPLLADGSTLLVLVSRGARERNTMEQALQAIMEGTAAHTGERFFNSLVRELAVALGVKYAFVAELLENRTRVQTLAFWADGAFLDNIEYDLTGTPCEVVCRGETVYYTRRVHRLFPGEPELAERGIESYFGVPLVSRDGEKLGHLAVYHDQEMVKEFRGMAILRIFANRAMAELERQRAVTALAHSEERLAGILASAMDAIITIDAAQDITLFNAAAEKVFRCKAAEVIGQPFERLLSKRFGNLLKGYCLAVRPTRISNQQLWAPEGLTARRADGEEFPVEATLSPMEVAGERLYTVILRDFTERRQAEEALHKLQLQKVYLQEEVKTEQNFDRIVGESEAMREVFSYVEQVAVTDSTVLLTGETGTGKEVIARVIHDLSPRKDRFMVKVNCAALPGELIESELFGHEKGAFTGATAQRKGRFELADGGTIFLDEVGELAAPAQAKLLRILQEQEFERVGGGKSIQVDVRIVAATNRDLAEMVQDGSFRSDLYYRLNVFPVRLPALRERPTDIPLLAQHFLEKFARKMGKPVTAISPESLAQFTRYAWPGNVRELQNVIERAVILTRGPVLEIRDALDLRLGNGAGVDVPEPATPGSLEDMERNYIAKVLEDNRWVIEGEQGAAAVLGLKPSTLRSRMQKLGIRKPPCP